MIAWCPRCGEGQSPSDAGRLVICWSCDQVVLTVADDHDDIIDVSLVVGGVA